MKKVKEIEKIIREKVDPVVGINNDFRVSIYYYIIY